MIGRYDDFFAPTGRTQPSFAVHGGPARPGEPEGGDDCVGTAGDADRGGGVPEPDGTEGTGAKREGGVSRSRRGWMSSRSWPRP